MASTPVLNYITFDEFLRHWAAQRPDGLALVEGERRTTYAQAEVLTRQLIAFLQAHGVRRGDRFAWYGKNSDRYFLLLFAAARMGAVIAPVGWRLAPREVGYILADTESKLVIAGEDFVAAAQAVEAGIDNGPAVFEAAAAFAEAAGMEPAASFAQPDPDEAVLQLYTSGTTGNPKGVLLSNRNLFSLRRASRVANMPWDKLDAQDCLLGAMPIAHIGGTGSGPIAVANGIPVHVLPEYTPDGTLAAIEAGTTLLFLVPAAVQFMIQHPRAATTDFSRLKYLMYGAAPMPLELLKEAVKMMPATGFIQLYGMTETTGTVSLLPPEDHDVGGNRRMRSAGKAVPGVRIEVRGPDNQPVPTGEIGEICILSPSNTAGYWKLPEATASTIDADGWLHTGDAGVMDEDGYVYIQDRIKDMIISGGENVYPAEVESAIYGHPAIAEVAVIGVPSAKWGEEVKACVVAKPGYEIDAADVIAWARERIAAFKAPKSVDVIPLMPRNASGKILRRELRAPYWEGQERQIS
ncbi:MAG: long-chain-fatty-acid--CoA ligase [Erythrobacteraceae bacterium]|jgi:fatty-acyl-CoA synthase|nr:long-chain-fatty-acid--CoA ligase [Erythrobacteraceae bacterium]